MICKIEVPVISAENARCKQIDTEEMTIWSMSLYKNKTTLKWKFLIMIGGGFFTISQA